MYLPCKLIGMNRRYETREMINPLEKAALNRDSSFQKYQNHLKNRLSYS